MSAAHNFVPLSLSALSIWSSHAQCVGEYHAFEVHSCNIPKYQASVSLHLTRYQQKKLQVLTLLFALLRGVPLFFKDTSGYHARDDAPYLGAAPSSSVGGRTSSPDQKGGPRSSSPPAAAAVSSLEHAMQSKLTIGENQRKSGASRDASDLMMRDFMERRSY